ncbi:unnamed protein product, partial [marine sediment metagenome]
ELKDILRERDEITKDRFDHIIEECPILDIEKRIEMEDFLKISSQTIAERIKMSSEEIHDALLKREQDTSTAISPFLAMPSYTLYAFPNTTLAVFLATPGR